MNSLENVYKIQFWVVFGPIAILLALVLVLFSSASSLYLLPAVSIFAIPVGAKMVLRKFAAQSEIQQALKTKLSEMQNEFCNEREDLSLQLHALAADKDNLKRKLSNIQKENECLLRKISSIEDQFRIEQENCKATFKIKERSLLDAIEHTRDEHAEAVTTLSFLKKDIEEKDEAFQKVLSEKEEVYQRSLADKQDAFQRALNDKDVSFNEILCVKEKTYQQILEDKEQTLQRALQEKEDAFQKTLLNNEEAFQKALNIKEEAYQVALQEKEEALSKALVEAQAAALAANSVETVEVMPVDIQTDRLLREKEGLYKQLREQFEEKSSVLDATRKELFHTETQVLGLKHALDLQAMSDDPEFTKLQKELSSCLSRESILEKEIDELHKLISNLI